MIRIEAEPLSVMTRHGEDCFPKECCGILLGRETAGGRIVTHAVPCRNAYDGDQKDRFHIDPRDQLAADRKARQAGLSVLGFFHSHPDEESYFSATDLKHSWPWYSNVVMSVRAGKFTYAKSFIANDDQSAAEPEDLHY